jgi:asparagine synthase (glutamine-hydrolysing)
MVSAPAFKRWSSPKYAGLLEYGGTYAGAYLLRRGLFMPWELTDVLDADLAREGWRELEPMAAIERDISQLRSPRSMVSCLESCWYMRNQLLRDADWAGMAHSLEIRVPLVDIDLLRSTRYWAANDSLASKETLGTTPSQPLPSAVLSRPKTGFGVPVREWLSSHGTGSATPVSKGARGLRAWSQIVHREFSGHSV